MKNKTVLISIISLVVILLLGFVAYSYMQKPKDNKTETPATSNAVEEKKVVTNEELATTKTEEVNGSILDLINMGKSLMCSFDYTEDDIKSSGTTYVSGKQMRGEFVSTVEGKEVKSNIISDGTYFYSWSDTMPNTGMKMKIDNIQAQQTNTNTKQESTEALKDLNGKYNYKCGNWKSDINKFVVPTNVTFTDFSKVMQNAKDNTPNLCATCDVITDESAKAQCKTQFKCE